MNNVTTHFFANRAYVILCSRYLVYLLQDLASHPILDFQFVEKKLKHHYRKMLIPFKV